MRKIEALKILGLSEGATDDEIKSAHRKKVRENHPDRFVMNPEKKAEAEEKTKLINEARDVLINHTWDPDFGPRAAGRGNVHNPYNPTQNPYASNPFAGTPFDGTYVWTSWDGSRGSGGGNPFAGMPFDPLNPFSAFFHEKTAEEKLGEAENDFRFECASLLAKAVIVAIACALGQPNLGIWIYILTAIGTGFRRSFGGLMWIFIIPLIVFGLPALVLAFPSMLGTQVSIWTVIMAAVCVYVDVHALTSAKTIRDALKEHVERKTGVQD